MHCVPWHSRTDAVELDPAWSTDGRSVAFVRAPIATAGQLRDGYPGDAWNGTRRLYVAVAAGGPERIVEGVGGGVFDPQWVSPNALLAIAHGDLVEVDALTGRSSHIAAVAPDPQPFYGEETRPGRRFAVFVKGT